MDIQKRKNIRLKEYDYSSPGAYFITICTKDRTELLSKIHVGDDAHIVPENKLSHYGSVCDKYINNINKSYKNITVDKYIIMPNHIHMIISIHGTMWASSPTYSISTIIKSFKTIVSKETKNSFWQRSYYDHIIRNEEEYQKIWEYIDTNVLKWDKDPYNK